MDKNKKSFFLKKSLIFSSLFFCFVLAFLLVCNLIIIVKQFVKPNSPPFIFGLTGMIVQSNSMSGDRSDHIEVDDFIFVKKVPYSKLQVNDIIAFYDNKIIITHRIIGIEKNENDEDVYITKGDANNVRDENLVTNDQIIGKYIARIPKVGLFISFLQKPIGTVLIISAFSAILFSFYFYKTRKRTIKN